ncbi:STAS domain-containing protein [Gilvimarinus algae]|uniref:Anti-sigma factor antagonist n=1 Tax=Gilvimarinus algae TaxID=3058037 RepID=A0ABT8TG42_9GAMM|nr:STAS domain-containing protein [Gilvimarinus sp. SDUM040014]MDO3383062.1 STAS domain-containing protein [Gilvimarinus sp. SDUM040014]
MSLDVTVLEQTDTCLRLSLQGSLDSDTYPLLENRLDELMTERIQLVAFDLQALDFISSAGLRVFFATVKKMKARGGRVAVSHMQPGVRKVFDIVKALPDLSVFASVEEMDEYLASFQK